MKLIKQVEHKIGVKNRAQKYRISNENFYKNTAEKYRKKSSSKLYLPFYLT